MSPTVPTKSDSTDTAASLPAGVSGGKPLPEPKDGNPSALAHCEESATESPASTATQPDPAPVSAQIYPGPSNALDPVLGNALSGLQSSLNMPLWLFVHPGDENEDFAEINNRTRDLYRKHMGLLPEGKPVALLIHSPGGQAKCAYQIARLLRHRCGAFVAVVPRYAKSAGTLLALGGAEILMSEQGELGPLDAQLFDGESEEYRSALDEFQALERLNAFALEVADRAMMLMLRRTRKKIDTLLPRVLHFAADLTRPLLEKTDPVRYTTASRALKIAEEYATRLLQPKYSLSESQRISRHLVEKYPDHGFVIDREEASKFGLKTLGFTPEQEQISDTLANYLDSVTLMGPIAGTSKP